MGATASARVPRARPGLAGPRGDLVDVLHEVAVLRDRGVLTEAEFQRFRTDVVAARRASRPDDGSGDPG